MRKASDCADNIGDRVQRSNLVEMHGIHGRLVHGSFGYSQALEHRGCTTGDGSRKRVEQGHDVRKMADYLRVGHLNMHLGRAQATSVDILYSQDNTQFERVDRFLQNRQRHAHSDQATEQHVAAGPCGSVDPRDFHDAAGFAVMLRIRIAAQAAPKPLSMLTTVTPCAQLARALFKAVPPPAATP